MNIFVLDTNPRLCAKYHCDKHAVKMILEHSQILCTTHWMNGSEAPYKLTHKNHPCSIWARECLENYLWLIDLTRELCKEYTSRYGKKHKCEAILDWCEDNIPNIPEKGYMTPFALAMPNEYKVSCPVQSYRNYYNGAKTSIAVWKYSEKPNWFQTT